jgi:hypothetical protein
MAYWMVACSVYLYIAILGRMSASAAGSALRSRAICAELTGDSVAIPDPRGQQLRHHRGVPVARARSVSRPGIMEVMSKSSSRRFPVTVTHLPVTRCQICRRTVAYRPGSLSEVLTGHYRRAHPEALGRPSR